MNIYRVPPPVRKIATIFVFSLLFTGSVDSLTAVSAQTPKPPVATVNKKLTQLREELYFGRSQPGGRVVSEEQWQEFLDTQITPRFPDGLTVIDAYGQFLNSSGNIIAEQTKVLILIYPNSQDKEKAIQEIINLYKAQFQQESVLRVTNVPARVNF